ncbi:6-hydroxy-3-succinoylpyridine 3-monooxygenase HspA [termite gut metagenome]|uniref:6-hydroxy-3-succinoylpyridine 3-monooxygenase HspA n=2 Tax=termite gut metagenome TaxID=433724 RepID=A0A5J4R3Q5_9ZZZZ
MNERVTFYVDGFNFYYGLRAKKNVDRSWLNSYWIDVVKLFSQFLGKDQMLEKVIYFTASPLNPDKSSRQGAFLNANKLLNDNKLEVVRGKYLKKSIECPQCHYTIIRPEEKKTDVNIAIRMVGDCVQDKTDVLVLVSGGSDLIPPIEFIQKNHPDKKIRVYFPPTIISVDLRNNMKAHKGKVVFLENNKNKFINSVMSNDVIKDGKTYSIPPKWKIGE